MVRRFLVVLISLLVASLAGAAVPSPEQFLGHRVGEDRYLAPWPEVVAYHRAVAAASDRVSIESAGTSTLGADMPVVIVTSPANQARLPRLREIARRLANPDGLTPTQIDALVEEGRVIVLVTCSIHSTEVGSTQMSMSLVHELATTRDPEVLSWLDEAVLLVMPSINPDGQVMVVDWYNRWLGTPYEGGRMPWLYHHYVGHDDNRDFYMLTQKETQAVNDLLYHRWYPQVFLDEHQMGSTGPRMFVPPQADPLAPEVNSLIFRQADLLGTAMAVRLEEGGRTGVGSNMIFDSYWPGGTRNTAWWKNITGLLTEVASARLATPIFIDHNELHGSAKGLPEYRRQANFPSPWPGGWWRLSDIIAYERTATEALLQAAARDRRHFLRNLVTMAQQASERGGSEPPYAFIVPGEQHDPVAAGELVELILRHGVRVARARRAFTIGRRTYPAGTLVIPAAQPYREFLITMLRPQRYPEVMPYPGGPILPPYDATSWSLPISMGVAVDEAAEPVSEAVLEPIDAMPWPKARVAVSRGGWLLPHAADGVFAASNRLLARGAPLYWLDQAPASAERGDLWLPPSAIAPADLQSIVDDLHLSVQALDRAPKGRAFRVGPTRVGLFKPWRASMDEGWTRYLLERTEFPLVSLANDDISSGAFVAKVDVLVLPDIDPGIISTGEPRSERGGIQPSPLPPEYAGGIGERGAEALRKWIAGGGVVVALNRSTGYFTDLLGLPIKDVLEKVPAKEFECPGAMLRIEFDPSSPLAWGLRAEEAGYFDGSPAFATQVPDGRFDRRVVARYPDDRRDILVSGYLLGAEHLERRAAVVETTIGKGRVVLIGFKPQNRAQTVRTFKLLYNALYLPTLEEVELP